MEIAITKLSSKGQVVIPTELRKGLREGEKLLVIREGETLVLKRATELDKKFREDVEFARRTEAAYRRYEQGRFKKMRADKFLKALEEW